MNISSESIKNTMHRGTEYVKGKYNKSAEFASKNYKNHIKPALDKSIKYTKNLAADTIEFAKKNPKKIAVATGAAALLATGIVLLAKSIKNAKKAKAENVFLKDYAAVQSRQIQDLKKIAAVQQEIMNAKDLIIAAQRKSAEIR